jgi:hypothetical protein
MCGIDTRKILSKHSDVTCSSVWMEGEMKTLGNWEETYRRGILEVWEQGGCIRTGENCWIGGAEYVDSSNAVDDGLKSNY